MSLLLAIADFTNELKKKNIDFGIIGGFAVFAYGGERTTFDIDFLIHGQYRESVKEVAIDLGLKVVNENAEVLQFSGSVQIDVIFANRPRSQEMLKNLRTIEKFPYPVVGPEDLVGLKIQAFAGDRSREYTDKADILTIFRNIPNLNLDKIKEYADIFGVWNEICEIRNRV